MAVPVLVWDPHRRESSCIYRRGVLLLFDITRGVDVGTKHDIYQLVVELAEERKALLYYSSETEEIAREVANRMIRLFTRGKDGTRRIYGGTEKFQKDPHWRDLLLFNEYFHGETGAGLGASHQTGWTGLVALLLAQSGAETSTTALRGPAR